MPGAARQPGYGARTHVHANRGFTAEHFKRWLTLFHQGIELGPTGPHARRARELADNVIRVHGHQLIDQAVSSGAAAPI